MNVSDERGWGKLRHRGGKEVEGRMERGHVKRVMLTSVSGYTTSGLVHIGHRREEGGWVAVGGVGERCKRGNVPMLSLGHVGLLHLWES